MVPYVSSERSAVVAASFDARSLAPVLPTRCHHPRLRPRCDAAPISAPGKPGNSVGDVSGSSAVLPSQLIALKEWAVTCAALGAGEQTVLLRKGGIREPTFRPEAAEFLLFPTSFHSEEQLLKPGVAERYPEELLCDPKSQPQLLLRHWARVTGAWTTANPSVLTALDGLHVWGERFLDARLKWRRGTPLTLLELRCYRLSSPLALPAREGHWGCFSWLDLREDFQAVGGTPGAAAAAAAAGLAGSGDGGGGGLWSSPALDDTTFGERQQLLRSQLTRLDAAPLQLGV